jgi:hypothetical protein
LTKIERNLKFNDDFEINNQVKKINYVLNWRRKLKLRVKISVKMKNQRTKNWNESNGKIRGLMVIQSRAKLKQLIEKGWKLVENKRTKYWSIKSAGMELQNLKFWWNLILIKEQKRHFFINPHIYKLHNIYIIV